MSFLGMGAIIFRPRQCSPFFALRGSSLNFKLLGSIPFSELFFKKHSLGFIMVRHIGG